MSEGCLICGKQVSNIIELLNHIDIDHPEVRKKVMDKLRR